MMSKQQQVQIPKRLMAKAVVDDPQVSTDLSVSRTYTPDQISSLGNLGQVKIDGNYYKSLTELGRFSKSLGTREMMTGAQMVNVGVLVQFQGYLGQIVANEPVVPVKENEPDGPKRVPTHREKMDAGRLAGYIAGAMAKSDSSVSKTRRDDVEVAIQVDKQRRQSFQPGMTITVQQPATPSSS